MRHTLNAHFPVRTATSTKEIHEQTNNPSSVRFKRRLTPLDYCGCRRPAQEMESGLRFLCLIEVVPDTELGYRKMKKRIADFKVSKMVTSTCFLLFMISCTNSQTNDSAKLAEIERRYQDSIVVLKNQLQEAYDMIGILKFPADQRLNHIIELYNSEEYKSAKKEINELKSIFPNAKENVEADKYIAKIQSIEAAKRAKEERIKALGFKAINPQTTIKIDYNTVTFSSIGVGGKFIFDSYDDYYHYKDADRGYKYVSMQMSVTSTNNSPQIPEVALYTISGDKMKYEGCFMTRFARWRDYGAYLGNYHDSSNDFAKVSTVKFKLGIEVSNESLAKPYAIVLMKENVLYEKYERFDNPPYSYTGSANYPSTLSLDDFMEKYAIIKCFNLK